MAPELLIDLFARVIDGNNDAGSDIVSVSPAIVVSMLSSPVIVNVSGFASAVVVVASSAVTVLNARYCV